MKDKENERKGKQKKESNKKENKGKERKKGRARETKSYRNETVKDMKRLNSKPSLIRRKRILGKSKLRTSSPKTHFPRL